MDWQHDDEVDGFLRQFQPRQPRQPRGLMAVTRNRRMTLWLAVAASAAVLLIVFFASTGVFRSVATIVDGPLYRISAGESRPVASGERIKSGEIMRTETGAGAMLALSDGSRVEMRSGSELSVERGDDGLRVRLNRGGVILSVARQQTGHLHVQTKDMTVSVVGTVFVVNAEETGSRVAVIEGEVQVQQGAMRRSLRSGQQVATSPQMESRPVAEEIAWSRGVAEHLALLQQSVASPAAANAFEVASVKLTPTENAGNFQPSITLFPPGGSFRKTNTTLKMLVQLAYSVQEYQVSGGPSWVNFDRYDVEAKSERSANRDEVLRMIQTLLADRFQLKLHRETNEGPIYELALGRNGSKLSSVPDSSSADVRIGRYTGRRSMAQLAQYLGSIVGRPVVDRTGLTGIFDIRLEFTPELVPIGPNGPIVDPNGPSIFTALQEQLGLRLESGKGPVETVVIEGAEKPQPN
jgi:uncharacterized protein (TIGR03435 family)